MTEKEPIDRTTTPLTVTSLSKQLQRCGLATGQTVLVHLAMSKLGWVIGAAEAVIMALLTAVGDSGTIMMVTNYPNNTDPANWQHPPVPEAWWQVIREHTPAYNPYTTPHMAWVLCQNYSAPGLGLFAAGIQLSHSQRWDRMQSI